MRTIILAAFAAISLGIGVAIAQPAAKSSATYHAPAYNSYQNNWMGNGG